MSDLPDEWIQHADELGPHGKPLPPETWTPEREAAVARWRDELMAAGEARDREKERRFAPKIRSLRLNGVSYKRIAGHLKMTYEEIKDIEGRAIWRAKIAAATSSVSAPTQHTSDLDSAASHPPAIA